MTAVGHLPQKWEMSPVASCQDETRSLRVLLLTVGLGVGGTETQILELASRLQARGTDVVVCALKGEDVVAQELRQRGVRVVTLKGRGSWDVLVLLRLAKLIRLIEPDVLHSFLFFANIGARLIGRLLAVPVVISSYRGVEVHRTGVRALVDRMTLGWADAVTCCSDAVRGTVEQNLRLAPKKLVTIHNGIAFDRFIQTTPFSRANLGLHDQGPVIGTVCRLEEPVKGVSLLIEAVAQLAAQRPALNVQLLVVGEGPAGAALRAQAERLHLGDRVVFAGLRRDVERLLPLMDVFVLPSQYEGFGIALIEAMAAGLPVIGTDVGGVPEIITHQQTGLLVPPGDAQALATAIERFLLDGALAQAMAKAGQRDVCSRFSLDRAVSQHETLYRACVSKREAVNQMRASSRTSVMR